MVVELVEGVQRGLAATLGGRSSPARTAVEVGHRSALYDFPARTPMLCIALLDCGFATLYCGDATPVPRLGVGPAGRAGLEPVTPATVRRSPMKRTISARRRSSSRAHSIATT